MGRDGGEGGREGGKKKVSVAHDQNSRSTIANTKKTGIIRLCDTTEE